ncbi:hypothetical protein TrLO_g9893 [Triparma laevis f. longispina]|uniref:RanBP2-type domain-containing protein n=1 Tax=Triparma laevis f. longispina TaxID=1714387 RepID=A0A9W7FE17_9STRA|nr:hypothetical protein TrLO_g9893 [Triparma laevis f. longispina]
MPSSRLIALLDLDCFYAQCESVRLDIPSHLPVAVFQWSGAIAVNYPARAAGIKRFMKLEDMKKVASDIVAIHVEVETLSSAFIEEAGDEDVRKSKYKKQYSLTCEEKALAFSRENGHFPSRTSAQANIERYRYVSGLIFSRLRIFLDEVVGQGGYKLEKASIDELYVDLTEYVNKSRESTPPPLTGKVVIIGGDKNWTDDAQCLMAANLVSRLREDIKTTLGYTLSAGLAINKTMAKLAAGRGKPDGLAVLPRSSEAMKVALETTSVLEVRGYGGKGGKIVCENVLKFRGYNGPWEGDEYEEECKKLSMKMCGDCPADVLGSKHDWRLMNNGEEGEEVQHTKPGAPTKSITTFKSFVGDKESCHRKDDVKSKLGAWIEMMVKSLVRRVLDDSKRNNRWCKTLCVYFCNDVKAVKSKSTKFPGKSAQGKEESVTKFFIKTLEESTVWPIIRVGVSADNFFPLGAGLGIFLSKENEAGVTKPTDFKTTKVAKVVEKSTLFATVPPKSLAGICWNCKACTYENEADAKVCEICKTSRSVEDDEEYAKRLQKQFNDEEAEGVAIGVGVGVGEKRKAKKAKTVKDFFGS